jgi:hypothetical protein
MENQENELEKDEIVNPEQFQVDRSANDVKPEDSEDAGYTEDEVEFADGQGTRLQEEFEVPEGGDNEDDQEEDSEVN